MQITKENIDLAIEEIKKELPTFEISPENLEKFGTVDELDEEYLSCVNGAGGSYVKFLSLLTKKFQFNNVVELGNQTGLSTLAIYDQLPQHTSFTTIDIIEDIRYCPERMKSDQRVSILFGDVCDTNILKKIPKDIDLLFTDTIHFNFQIQDEFAVYQHLLADTAIVAVDDIHKNDKGIFWDGLHYEKWDLTELCHVSGWGLFLYKRTEPLTQEDRWLKAVTTSSQIWQRKFMELNVIKEAAEEVSVKNRLKKLLKKSPSLYKALIKIKKIIK